MNRPFTQYKPWMQEHYGDALFRVPVQLASSCPHGRCVFCAEHGAKAQQTQRQDDPFQQADEAVRFARRRYRAKKFMLYIQAFTADLTDPAQQQTIIGLLKNFPFDSISIGTRPDCLPPAALDFLVTLAQKRRRGILPRSDKLTLITHANEAGSLVCNEENFEVWIELGVQTANDETLKQISRGHDWACSKKAILNLAERGLYVAPHVIIGLPGETADDWNRTADELARLPICGIKVHNLHVTKGTRLAEEYAAAPFPVLNHWEYTEALIEFLRRIPPEIPVMRISTDTPDEQLIVPQWHLEKGQFLDYVTQQMTMREISQGDLRNDGIKEQWNNEKSNIPELQRSDIPPVTTADGSVTFFSEDWKEHYHTQAGARLEAQKKFVEPSGLALKLNTLNIKLLDVCFGLGNNSLAALCAQSGTTHQLDITALEMDKRIVRAAADHFQPLATDRVEWKHVLKELLRQSAFHRPHFTLSLLWGDARWLIQNIEDNVFDVVFHDPFSTQHCPELWTVEFFKQLYRVMNPDALLLTYSSARPVRGALREAGFLIAETEPGHQMGNGTAASCTEKALVGFSQVELVDNRRAIPYRDPHLCATAKAILRQRQEAVELRNKHQNEKTR